MKVYNCFLLLCPGYCRWLLDFSWRSPPMVEVNSGRTPLLLWNSIQLCFSFNRCLIRWEMDEWSPLFLCQYQSEANSLSTPSCARDIISCLVSVSFYRYNSHTATTSLNESIRQEEVMQKLKTPMATWWRELKHIKLFLSANRPCRSFIPLHPGFSHIYN